MVQERTISTQILQRENVAAQHNRGKGEVRFCTKKYISLQITGIKWATYCLIHRVDKKEIIL